VESIRQGYSWIQFKLDDNENIKWYRAQMESTSDGTIYVQAIFGYKHPKNLVTVKKLIGESSVEIPENTEKQFLYYNNEENRLPGSRLMERGDYQLKSNPQQWEKDFEYARTLESVESAKEHMLNTHPKHYCSQMKRLTALFKSLKPRKETIKYRLDEFTEPRIPEEDLANFTIVLVGRSSLGKTCYAKAHFNNPAVIKNKVQCGKITSKTDGLIFDDIEMYTWTPSKVKSIVDLKGDGEHSVKYESVDIKEGVPRFVIVNNEDNFWPRSLFGEDGWVSADGQKDYEGIERRIIIKNITKPLFNKSMEDLEKEFSKANASSGKVRPNLKALKRRYDGW
jgi:hypothetical protein